MRKVDVRKDFERERESWLQELQTAFNNRQTLTQDDIAQRRLPPHDLTRSFIRPSAHHEDIQSAPDELSDGDIQDLKRLRGE